MDERWSEIEKLASDGRVDEAGRALAIWLREREGQPGPFAAAGRLAERLGLAALAVRAWSRVVGAAPGDHEGWESLAVLYDEMGDRRRAAACRGRLAELGPPPPPSADEATLAALVDRFEGRRDVWARMYHHPDRGTGYSPVRAPLDLALWRDHLAGAVTAGLYLLREDHQVGLGVFDLDLTQAALKRAAKDRALRLELLARVHAAALRLAEHLRQAGLDPVLVDSGYKGRHLWIFLPEVVPAADLRRVMARLLASCPTVDPDLKVELFPKQDKLGKDGLGNLVKLPLGIHRKTARRAVVLGDDGQPLADGISRLLGARRVALGELALPEVAQEAVPLPTKPPRSAWDEPDWLGHPELGRVLGGCAVLRAVVRRTLVTQELSREQAVVLEHTVGHLPEGPDALNALFDRVPGWPAEGRLGAPHRGSPTSCSTIRRRLPEVTRAVPCNCVFAPRPGRYDNPLRHLEAEAERAAEAAAGGGQVLPFPKGA